MFLIPLGFISLASYGLEPLFHLLKAAGRFGTSKPLQPISSSVYSRWLHLSMGTASVSCQRSKPATCTAGWQWRHPLLCSSRPSRSHTYLGTQRGTESSTDRSGWLCRRLRYFFQCACPGCMEAEPKCPDKGGVRGQMKSKHGLKAISRLKKATMVVRIAGRHHDLCLPLLMPRPERRKGRMRAIGIEEIKVLIPISITQTHMHNELP